MPTAIRLVPVRPRRTAVRRPSCAARRWELAIVPAEDAARCAAVLDELEGWSRADWLAAGRRALASADAPAGREAPDAPDALAALEALLARRGLGVTAWLVREAVETAAQQALGGHASGAEQASLAAARRAATWAALAQLVRPARARDA